jgi:hypothetical protein
VDNQSAVKYFAPLGLLVVLVTAGAAAAHTGGANDGALSVKNADGRVVMVGKGAVIGRFDKGQVTIKDPNPFDGTGPIVTGADRVEALGEKTTRYSGSNIRFRMIGGSFTATVFGTDIDLSVVGRGMVTLDGKIAKGSGANSDASYAVNGGAPEDFPHFVLTFPLAAPPSSAGG